MAKLSSKTLAAVLILAKDAGLVGELVEVGWVDGPIWGFAVTDEVCDDLEELSETG